MATLTMAIHVSILGGLRGAQRAVLGHRWLVRWNEDGSYTLLHLPDPPAAYELKSWRFAHQGELVAFARAQGWPIEHDTGWMPLEGRGPPSTNGAAPSGWNASRRSVTHVSSQAIFSSGGGWCVSRGD